MTHGQPQTSGLGVKPLAVLFAILAVALLARLLALVVPPAPPEALRDQPSSRVAYVSPLLVGVTPKPETLNEDQEPQPVSTLEKGVRPVESTSVSQVPATRPRTTPPAPSAAHTSARVPDRAPTTRGTSRTSSQGSRPVARSAANTESSRAPASAPGTLPAATPIPAPAPQPLVTPPPPVRPTATPVPRGETREPRVIRRVEPSYPPIARSQGINGRVTVRITVAADGSVESVKIEQSTSPLFNQVSLKAAKQMKFEPGLVNGKPVRADYLQTFNFRTR